MNAVYVSANANEVTGDLAPDSLRVQTKLSYSENLLLQKETKVLITVEVA